MIIDGRRISDTIDTDICVIGSGPGGMTFALEMASSGLSIVLLESGGESPDADAQSLYAVENIGIDYAPVEETRSRYLGGSSNCWGGWCRPFDPLDFEERSWIPNSGWPLSRKDMQPFYDRANHYLMLSTSDYGEAAWHSELKHKKLAHFPSMNPLIVNQLVQFSPPVRFGRRFKDELSGSTTIKLVLMAHVTEVLSEDGGRTPIEIHATTIAGNSFKVNARSVVLAAGGIENARLLLQSRRSRGCGLGNEHDLVGRYYMDHPRVQSSTISSSKLISHLQQYDSRLANPGHRSGRNPNKIAAHFAPTPAAQRERRLPNSRSYLVGHYAFERSDSYKAITKLRVQKAKCKALGVPMRKDDPLVGEALAKVLRGPQGVVGVLDERYNLPLPFRPFTIETVIEPVPSFDSRVTLSQNKDRFGMNVPRLNWHLSNDDKENIIATTEFIKTELLRQNIGKVNRRYSEKWDGSVIGCAHHMGTTRMHVDPKRGVVDMNAKLHHSHGIYCMGSSVFATVGNDCPTLTIVALAIRLADFFKRDLNGVLLQA